MVIILAAVAVAATLGFQPHSSVIPREVTAIACGDANHCMAVGLNFSQVSGAPASYETRSSDDGKSWLTAQAGPVSGLTRISCETASICISGGQADRAATTRDGGTKWKVQPSPVFSSATACTSANQCEATGFENGTGNAALLVLAHDRGLASVVRMVPGMENPTGLACPDDEHCLVAGEAIVPVGAAAVPVLASTGDAGTTWQHLPLPSGTGSIIDLICIDDSNCVAVTGKNRFLATTNAGATWANRALLGATPSALVTPTPIGVACVDASTCVVVDVGIPEAQVTSDRGLTWHGVPLPLNRASPTFVECQKSGSCLIGGASSGQAGPPMILRSGNAGRSWNPVWQG